MIFIPHDKCNCPSGDTGKMESVELVEPLVNSDLVIDKIYSGKKVNNFGADPIAPLLPGTGNQGGFRIAYQEKVDEEGIRKPCYVALFSTGDEPEWPDYLDIEHGYFRYFGDNREPGNGLHDTRKGGNKLLRDIFDKMVQGEAERKLIPPFFLFTKVSDGTGGRKVRFLGLAAPGSKYNAPDQDLIAVWRSKKGKRFQNYEAVFSILDTGEERITRRWLDTLRSGDLNASDNAPRAWKNFISKGRDGIKPLVSKKLDIRSKEEQLPSDSRGWKTLDTIIAWFADEPTSFEHFAVELVELMDPKFRFAITRPSRDGGRDAIGHYSIGLGDDKLEIDCALEAKCYHYSHGVGVKMTSRLISRIRHRQFGVIVSTSYIDNYAYKEIKSDLQPILVLSGGDIVKILRQNHREDRLEDWLSEKYPKKGEKYSI